MCEPISIGIGIGAAVGAAGAAITGGDVLQGALFGAIGGGFAGAGAGIFGNMATNLALGATGAGVATATSVGLAAGLIGGVTSTLSGVAMNMLTPKTPDYSQFGYGAQPYEPQGFSSQHATVTGSGGRQAAAVLAEEIKRSRTLRQRQQEETTAYNVAGELASTGLQIA